MQGSKTFDLLIKLKIGPPKNIITTKQERDSFESAKQAILEILNQIFIVSDRYSALVNFGIKNMFIYKFQKCKKYTSNYAWILMKFLYDV